MCYTFIRGVHGRFYGLNIYIFLKEGYGHLGKLSKETYWDTLTHTTCMVNGFQERVLEFYSD